MINTAYLNIVDQAARAAMSGIALPSITGKLLSHLPITAIFFAGEAAVIIDDGTGKCVIKPKDAPAGTPALIDTAAELVSVGSETHYLFEWASADSLELRAFLDAQADPSQPVEMRCEIEYAIDGETARIAFPILMLTAYTRPDDPAPSATAETSWEWLKLRAPDANGFSHDDPTKTLSVPGVAAQTSAAAEKPAQVDGDKIPLIDSEAGGLLKWLGWSSVKTGLKNYFDGIYSTFSGAFADLSGIPTTLGGYGITDALTAEAAAAAYEPLIADGALPLAKLATDPLARANHTGTQDVSTLTGVLPVLNGGTGGNSAYSARNTILPTKTGKAGKVLAVNSAQNDYELVTNGALPRGHIAGLNLSYVGTTFFTVSAGKCRDETDTYDMVLASSFTKDLQPFFGEGTNQSSGSSDSFPLAVNTNYSVWLILNLTSGAVDVLTSTSATSPVMPVGYTIKRRIGWLRTETATTNILSFVQKGDLFLVATSDTSYSTTSVTSAAVSTITLPCPPNVLASIRCSTTASGIWYLTLDSVPGYLTAANIYNAVLSGATGARASAQLELMADGSSQIFGRTNVVSQNANIACRGWTDTRGRFD